VIDMFPIDKRSPDALFEQIKTGLRAEVVAGRLKPGQALPDEYTLAGQLDVSHMTVRRAVVELSREGLLRRVSGKGTFVRDGFTPPAKTRRGAIAVVTTVTPTDRTSLYYHRMIESLLFGLEETATPLVFRPVREPYEEFVAELRADRSLRALVVIWAGDPALTRQLAKLRIPVVLLDSVAPNSQRFDEVAQESEAGVFAAVDHLIKLGHREIALMQGVQLNAIGEQRDRGYRRAMAANGLAVRPDLIHPVVFWSDAAYASMRRILSGPRVPTAMVCASDVLALGVMAAATEHGLRVPRDLSIVGFGDEGYFTVPQLSTVRVPVEQMGRAAARLLAQRLDDPTTPLQRVAFSAEWISRASCDCPRDISATTVPDGR
jgi:DNA-binding LacI/PurR family transcriptional regulator